MVIHKIEMPNGGVAYCGDEMAEEIDREVLKQLNLPNNNGIKLLGTKTYTPKTSLLNIYCNEQFYKDFKESLGNK